MTPLQPHELLPLASYELQRPGWRREVLEQKAARRVELGPHLTFAFENRSTVRYQVQEILRVEGIEDAAGRAEQLAIYNDLFAHPGLGCTLLIGIPDADRRRALLPALQAAPRSAYLRLHDGRVVPARSRGPRVALAGVHFLTFDVRELPVAIGLLHPTPLERPLPPACRAALAQDLELTRSGWRASA